MDCLNCELKATSAEVRWVSHVVAIVRLIPITNETTIATSRPLCSSLLQINKRTLMNLLLPPSFWSPMSELVNYSRMLRTSLLLTTSGIRVVHTSRPECRNLVDGSQYHYTMMNRAIFATMQNMLRHSVSPNSNVTAPYISCRWMRQLVMIKP
jgi:hypothetical protein